MDVPRAAWMEEMPSSAISDEVSKPRPKRTPRGYIFQGLLGGLVGLQELGAVVGLSGEDEPVNHLEHALEDVEEASPTVDLEVFIFLFTRMGGQQRIELLYQAVQDVNVHDAQQDQESGGHGGADNATDLGESVKLVGDGRGRGCNND